ncbi:prolyl-tRNA synthetase associated domain-containing protein [bacterium]|nr:prolyl-tRNA synthetase associated domain-containing protein [bacterium]
MTDSRVDRAISFLEQNGIEYERHDHEAVFTVEQVSEMVSFEIGGARTKNLFVRDKKGKRHVLIVVPHDVSVDLMHLGEITGYGRLSFASEQRMNTYLGVSPGSVTLMGVINDPQHQVDVIIDSSIWNADFVRCHPLQNTSTVVLSNLGLKSIFQITGHVPNIMTVPTL